MTRRRRKSPAELRKDNGNLVRAYNYTREVLKGVCVLVDAHFAPYPAPTSQEGLSALDVARCVLHDLQIPPLSGPPPEDREAVNKVALERIQAAMNLRNKPKEGEHHGGKGRAEGEGPG